MYYPGHLAVAVDRDRSEDPDPGDLINYGSTGSGSTTLSKNKYGRHLSISVDRDRCEDAPGRYC